MAQYYQVTSLEELHQLYPNLQLENIEGVQCMIQDDQFTDVQGQQIITTVGPNNIQITQNALSSPQCKSQQSVSNQYIVQQPTQYVIHQIDSSESQSETIQYVQQNNQQLPNQIDAEIQLSNQTMGCLVGNVGQNEQTLKQCIVKSDGSKQFLTQVQPILQQPIQIQQQFQGVDVGTNILVLQNQGQELVVDTKRLETVVNSPRKNQHHVIVQRQQQAKPETVITHKQNVVNTSDDANAQYSQQKLLNSKEEERLQPVVSNPEQKIIQPIHYYNQLTVIDGFSPSDVTAERSLSKNHEQQQIASQVLRQQSPQRLEPQAQQPSMQLEFKSKKIISPAGVTTIYESPQQVLLPQQFEMASPPPLNSRSAQYRKKTPQTTDVTTPVYIVQKLDSPLVIRQPQTKVRFQNANLGDNNENTLQSTSPQFENITKSIVSQVNEEGVQTKPQILISQEKPQNVPNQGTKSVIDKSGNVASATTEVIEHHHTTFTNLQEENPTKISVPSTTLNRNPTTTAITRIKTVEQQTERDVNNSEKVASPQSERFGNSMQCSNQTSPSAPQSHVHIQSPNHLVVSRGRGIRGAFQTSGVRQQYFPRGRGIQVQTSPPRHPNVEGNTIIRGPRPVRGGNRGRRGGWTSPGSNLGRPTLVKSETPQIIQTVADSDRNQALKEPVEETRVLVLLLNGEKRLIRIPSSQQSIFLGQILQQAGLTVTAPTSVAVEQVIDISNSDQSGSKTTNSSDQSGSTVKTTNVAQPAPTTGLGTPNIIATIQPQHPGNQSSSLQVSIPRNHMELAAPGMATSSSVQTIVSASNIEIVNSQTQTPQTLTSSQLCLKEEPRFVSGYMAICPYCGIQSLDFNKCIRCRRKLPENVKAKPIFNEIRIQSEKAAAENEKLSNDGKSEKDEKQSDSSENNDKTLLRLSDKKKIKPCVKKKKITDEPTEILILSSDDEEESKSKKTDLIKPSLNVLKKEPVYIPIELSEKDVNNMIKEGSLNEDLMKNVQPGLFTTLQCRTIRIGSYKAQPKDRIMISNKGIRLVVNTLKNETAVIVIPLNDVLKVLLHFGKQIPVIFIYPHQKIGVQIRNLLRMDNKFGPYYDPASSNEVHKRITLLPEKISEENKIILQKIIAQDKVEELSEKEANEILLRASPPDVYGFGLNRTIDGVRKILVYPPPPEKGGITLNNQDYACLGEDQFLNDVIIDFYLKYLMQRILSPEDRNRTHVFSTFFYKRLTTKPKALRKNDPENDPSLSPAEKRHMRVKGWTKQVNLFEKDFIIVPINEHSHWFLAIICFPGLTGPVRFADNTPIEPEEITLKKHTESVQIGNTTITHIIKTDGNTISLELDCGFDRDEAEGDQDDLHPSSSDEDNEPAGEERSGNSSQVQIPLLAPVSQTQDNEKDEKVKAVKRKVFKEPIKQPCILIFDSLAGASRVRVVATLRDYLKIEYKAKMGQDRDFSKDTIKGAVPRVPQQNNFTDCGLYVLQYVESFFQDPLHDFKLPLKYLQEWFPEEVVSCKRQKLAALIRNLMDEQGINVDEMNLPVLTFTNGNIAGETQMAMEDVEEEDEENEEMNDEDEEMNEEDEAVLKHQIQVSGFDNEEEDEDENMDVAGDEEEEEDDVDDEDDEEEEDDEDEELEVGEIPRRWLTRTGPNFCNELDSSIEKGECTLMRSHSLVNYDDSESEEEEYHGSNRLDSSSEIVENDFCDSDQSSALITTKSNVPQSELQEDFESQLTCTTIDKNMECKSSQESTDMVISDDDDCEMDERETSFEKSLDDQNVGVVSSDLNESASAKVERMNLSNTKETIFIEGKTKEVTDMIKKLVSDKNITISRREDILNSNSLKKHLEMKRLKVKDCDNSEEEKPEGSPSLLQSPLTSPSPSLGVPGATCQQNLATQKRTFQALKSVRIPKKVERTFLDVSGSKRQKVDET